MDFIRYFIHFNIYSVDSRKLEPPREIRKRFASTGDIRGWEEITGNKEKLCLMYSVVLFIQLTVEWGRKHLPCTVHAIQWTEEIYWNLEKGIKRQSFVNIQRTVVKCILTRTDMSYILQKKKKLRIPLLQNDSLFCFD